MFGGFSIDARKMFVGYSSRCGQNDVGYIKMTSDMQTCRQDDVLVGPKGGDVEEVFVVGHF